MAPSSKPKSVFARLRLKHRDPGFSLGDLPLQLVLEVVLLETVDSLAKG